MFWFVAPPNRFAGLHHVNTPNWLFVVAAVAAFAFAFAFGAAGRYSAFLSSPGRLPTAAAAAACRCWQQKQTILLSLRANFVRLRLLLLLAGAVGLAAAAAAAALPLAGQSGWSRTARAVHSRAQE